MNFNDITGQQTIVNRLKTQIKSYKIGHAYIFSGSKGIGKRTIAKIFASIAICKERGEDGSCGKCQPCRLFRGGTNPDFYCIKTEKNSIGVEDIRKMQKDVSIRPLYSPKKVYLIQEAEKMTVQAQNCLLKTLEEPPLYTLIIMTTSNYEGLLETIRSRSVNYSFKKNTFEEVKKYLIDNEKIDLGEVDFIASYADGVIGKAKELSESDEFKLCREKTIEILLKLNESNAKDIFSVYDFFEENKENIEEILDIMLVFYRDILVTGKFGNEKMLINSDKKDIILRNVNNFSTERIYKNIKVVDDLRNNIKRNVNYQLAVEVMLMKLQEEEL
ncbi:DNA polymerase III subunit delta' C-terminal domain-containing protein [Herbivorax sp. ANBcel31]|uniref:DNA polymerase III subunit n=1 Tax=Herbivorax sp. ANBcel31 TaxID=3069754 RepID=UPI0027B3B8B4|nr:DNA polymerase III subunit delta' C-terminal domain-containing protein [Herbivorax sp. ANBcel31]MDQ2086369.1 DNA polymerase III subunit delta' C-terminal domain-containing protein [Herbivorax sp. ANBcel31]